MCKGCVLIDKPIFLAVIIREEKSQEREQGEIAEQDLAFISVCIDISIK